MLGGGCYNKMESRFDCFSTASHSNTVLLSLIPCCYNLNAPSLVRPVTSRAAALLAILLRRQISPRPLIPDLGPSPLRSSFSSLSPPL
mmetsp:Transcript_25557/g.57493  ORF Transcript_25557/g.57493 Transcript_25557/m.57493 type:complete len:88 (+) Transcript_25557:453-716(+)